MTRPGRDAGHDHRGPSYNSGMGFPVRAITLDLDDTLWPFAPIGERIDRVLDDWLRQHSPVTAEMFPVPRMRELRDRTWRANAHLAHDLATLRRMTIERALRESGGDLSLVDAAYDTFYAERNRVDFYPDAVAGLERIARLVPIGALSNGNADLRAIGIDHLFSAQVHPREYGAAKPDAGLFHEACAQLGVPPAEVLHVGDHVDLDVVGAMRAGLRGCWLHRNDHPDGLRAWPHAGVAPDLVFDSLTGLADWIEASR